MKNFEFNIRWKEELDGFVDGHRFTLEITMGSLHVYFPSEETWERSAPDWAKGMWPDASEAAARWATNNSIPFEVDERAWVSFESA